MFFSPRRLSKSINVPVILTYFDVRGKGEPIRLLLEDAGVKYEDNRRFDWRIEKQNKDKYLFGQLPHILIGDLNIVQSDAILRFLARELGYYGNSSRDMVLIDMAVCAVEDIRVPYIRVVYSKNFETEKDDFIAKNIPEWMNNIQDFLIKQSAGQEYIAGEEISFADFLLFEQITVLTYLDSSLMARYPTIKAYLDRIASRPRLGAYLRSGRRPWKVNGTDNGTPPEYLRNLE